MNDMPKPLPIEATTISSVEDFIVKVKADSEGWPYAWFRGEPGNVPTPLLPRLYRPRPDGSPHNENRLLQVFRMKAPYFVANACPGRSDVDQWLFLAQHVGLPTRLLDWTESALVGLYFALGSFDRPEALPVVWMLNPIALNELSVDPSHRPTTTAFPLTWFTREGEVNIGHENIRGAWQLDSLGVPLPVAVQPTNVHSRISVQRSCFTVQGRMKQSLVEQVPQLLRRYEVTPDARGAIRNDLRMLGISESTVWPDVDGLARELRELY